MSENKLKKGRPADLTHRIETEIRCYDLLDRINVEYEHLDHEPAMTMEICAEIDKVIDADICKNLFLCNRQKTKFYLLLIPGNKKFLTKDISQQINSARLSFAGEEEMMKYLQIQPGSVSILGLMNDREHAVQLLIDTDVLKCHHIGIHPCINTTTLRIPTNDLMEKLVPALEHEPILVTL